LARDAGAGQRIGSAGRREGGNEGGEKEMHEESAKESGSNFPTGLPMGNRRRNGTLGGALANSQGIHTFKVTRSRDLVRPGLFFVPAQRGGLQWTRV
jgi:hypothetical protein